MAKTDAERALELIDQIALRQERMKVALEAILAEAKRGGMLGLSSMRVQQLAEIGLKRMPANG